MARGPILQRNKPFTTPTCAGADHRELAAVSSRYARLQGRLPTCYSPVCRCPQSCASTQLVLARLAFIKHAASVRPEPGSNSPLKKRGLRTQALSPAPEGSITVSQLALSSTLFSCQRSRCSLSRKLLYQNPAPPVNCFLRCPAAAVSAIPTAQDDDYTGRAPPSQAFSARPPAGGLRRRRGAPARAPPGAVPAAS